MEAHLSKAKEAISEAAKTLNPLDWQRFLAAVSEYLNTEDEHYVKPERRKDG